MRRRAPGLFVAVAAYAILVLPVLGLAQSGNQIVADRYSHAPSVPLSLYAGLALGSLAGRVGRARVLPAAAAAAVLLGSLSFFSTRLWASDLRLWERAIAVDPGNAVARFNRGVARRASGDDRGAAEDYSEAVRLRPLWPPPRYNRGNVRLDAGDLAGAIEDYTEAIRLGSASASKALGNRATARSRLGDLEGALEDVEAAIRLAPDDPALRRNAAILRSALGR
jgi:tetratricopeptide (TPR) repeat protein